MAGKAAPRDWQGGLNITYNIGPNLAKKGWTINLDVHTHSEISTVYNVVGMMKGSEEPDRYVILGNHRDAWVFGAADPSSGTAALMEVVRVLTDYSKKTGN